MTSLQRNFDRFDQENPHVYTLFKHYTLQALKAGMQKIAVALVIERIRWETSVMTKGDQFKINNNHRAYYARKFMREFPERGEVFKTKQLLGA